MNDPASSDFASPQAQAAWEQERRALLARLRAELPGVPIRLRLPGGRDG